MVPLITFPINGLIESYADVYQFFTVEPYACEPSSLPKYPPSKEMDAKLRDEQAKRCVISNSFYLTLLSIHRIPNFLCSLQYLLVHWADLTKLVSVKNHALRRVVGIILMSRK